MTLPPADFGWYINSIPASLRTFEDFKKEQRNIILNPEINPLDEAYPTYHTVALGIIRNYPHTQFLSTITDAYHHVVEGLQRDKEKNSCSVIMDTMFDICSYWNILWTLPFGDLVSLQFQTLIQAFVNSQDSFSKEGLECVYELIQSKLKAFSFLKLPKKSIEFNSDLLSELSQKQQFLPNSVDSSQLQAITQLPHFLKPQNESSRLILPIAGTEYDYVPPQYVVEDQDLMFSLSEEMVRMYFHPDLLLNLFTLGANTQLKSKQLVSHIVKVGIILLSAPTRSSDMDRQAQAAAQLVKDFQDYVLPKMSEELKLINSLQSFETKPNKSAILSEFERKKKEINERLGQSTVTSIFAGGDIKVQLLRIYLKVLKRHLRLLNEQLRLQKTQLIHKTTQPLEPLENIPLQNIQQTQLQIAFIIVRHLLAESHISEILIMCTTSKEWLYFLTILVLLSQDKGPSQQGIKIKKCKILLIDKLSYELSKPTVQEFNMLTHLDLQSFELGKDVPYEVQVNAIKDGNTFYGGVAYIENQQIIYASHLIIQNNVNNVGYKKISLLKGLQVIYHSLNKLPKSWKNATVLLKCGNEKEIKLINAYLRSIQLVIFSDPCSKNPITLTVYMIIHQLLQLEAMNGLRVEFQCVLGENKVADFLSQQTTQEELMKFPSTIDSHSVILNVDNVWIKVQQSSLRIMLFTQTISEGYTFEFDYGMRCNEEEQILLLQGVIRTIEHYIKKQSLHSKTRKLQIIVTEQLYALIKTTFQTWRYECTWNIKIQNAENQYEVTYDSLAVTEQQPKRIEKEKEEEEEEEKEQGEEEKKEKEKENGDKFQANIENCSDINKDQKGKELSASTGYSIQLDEAGQLNAPVIAGSQEGIIPQHKEKPIIPLGAFQRMVTKPSADQQVNNNKKISLKKTIKETSFRTQYIKRLLFQEYRISSNIWYNCENYYWTKIMELSKGNEIISNPELGWINVKLEAGKVSQNKEKTLKQKIQL